MNRAQRGRVLLEVGGLFLVSCALIRGLLALDRFVPTGIWSDLLLFSVALVFLLTPRVAERTSGFRLDEEIVLPRAFWGAFLRAGKVTALLMLVIYPVFLLGNHIWQLHLLPWCGENLSFVPALRRSPSLDLGRWPSNLANLALYQLICVGYAEEFFYRGYMQTRLEQVFPKKWRVLGAELGGGFWVTVILFTLGHLLVSAQWWQPFIFFPALIFGWLRARTGNILAGTIFHGLANTIMIVLDTLYGIRPV